MDGMDGTAGAAALSPVRLKQLNAAMNVGYNRRLSAPSDASPTRASAAARGNPFANFTEQSKENCAARTNLSPERFLQLNAGMNVGYNGKLKGKLNGKLVAVSPTRANAAARGNPFAIFECDAWKSSTGMSGSMPLSPVRLLELNSIMNMGNNTKLAAPSKATPSRASAEARGNPFARFGAAHSHSGQSANVAESVQGLAGAAACKVPGKQQRLEASVVFAKSSNRAASASATVKRTTISLQQQSKSLRPQSAAAFGVRLPKTAASNKTAGKQEALHVTSASPVPPPVTEDSPESLLFKRKPLSALQVSLPASPSGEHEAAAVNDDDASSSAPPAQHNNDVKAAPSSSKAPSEEANGSLLGNSEPSSSSRISLTALATTLNDLESQVAHLSKLSR